MTEQPPTQTDNPEPKSWRDEQREERWERRQARREALGSPGRGVALVSGLLLILLGIVFLLETSGYITIQLQNWGAIFILIPVVIAFDRAYREYRYAGNRLSARSRGAAMVGIVLFIVTVVILLNLSWAIFGPVLIILVGLGLLSNVIFPTK